MNADHEKEIARMDRALREFRIRSKSTNLPFLENMLNHAEFKSSLCITHFIDTMTESPVFQARDHATRLLHFTGDVVVNVNPEMKGRKG